MIITLSATVGPRPVRCRNNSRTLHIPSQAPRHSRRHRAQSDGQACSHNRLHYIHYSSQRASPPPRCTCAHVSQNTSPPRHGFSSCRPAHLSCAAGQPDLSAVLPPCMASLAGHEESVEAFSFLFYSLQTFLHRRHSCSRPIVSPYGIAVIASASALLPSSSPSRSVCLQTLPLLGINLFPSKIPPGPGLLILDPRKRIPCLVQRFPRPPPWHNMLPSRSISTPPQLPSTCCVIVATRDGDWERGRAGRRVCAVGLGLQRLGNEAFLCTASSCLACCACKSRAQLHRACCARPPARTHPPIHQNRAWSPYPPRQTHALHPEVDAPVMLLLALPF